MDRPTSMWLLMMTFALVSSVALYACVPHIEEDLAGQSRMVLGDLGAPKGWAMVDVDGQRLVLAGEAPGAGERDRIIQSLEAIPGVTDVVNQTVLRAGSDEGDELDSETVTSQAVGQPVNGPLPTEQAVEPAAAVPVAGATETTSAAVAVGQASPTPGAASQGDSQEVSAQAQAESPATLIEIPEPVVPPDLPPELASCQRAVNQLLAASGTFFGSSSSEVTLESKPAVEKIARTLQGCGAAFEIAGHTDNSGRISSNQRLSQARADAIREELLAQGIPDGRVSAVGYGESAPRVSNATPEGRRLNRRIEIKVHKPAAAVAAEENPT